MLTNNAGIRGIAKTLGMSFNTVHSTVIKAAAKCEPTKMKANGIYEVDEVCAYRKEGVPQNWVAYAIEKSTRQVIGIHVGRNNKSMLRKTVNEILITQPMKIYSDGNPLYKNLIPKHLHKIAKRFLRFIERLHLTVRNKLKMMNVIR